MYMTRAIINVSYMNTMLEIKIEDNGVGFEIPETFTGNGILNMKHRASLMHASLHLNTGPGKGTRVILQVKIK